MDQGAATDAREGLGCCGEESRTCSQHRTGSVINSMMLRMKHEVSLSECCWQVHLRIHLQ